MTGVPDWTTPQSSYPPTPRSIRQGRLPRAIPSLVGGGSFAVCARDLGLVAALTVAVTTAAGTLALMRLLVVHRRRALAATARRQGDLLVADAQYDLDAGGSPRDLNHRTGGEISSGADGANRAATAIAEAGVSSLRIRPLGISAKRTHAVEMRWDAMACAEVLPVAKRRTVVFLRTRQGARFRFELRAPAAAVRAALAAAGVAEATVPMTPTIAVGDRVRVADGRAGPVVAVVPREREPGYLEVFVQFPDVGVESWDSSEVVVETRANAADT